MEKQDYVMIAPRGSPKIRFLSEAEQTAYEEMVMQKYSSDLARKNLLIPREGSNLFKVLELQSQGIRIASLGELMLLSEQHRDWLSGHYADAPEVCIRGREYSFLARDLAKQIHKRKFKNPLVVTGLGPEESGESEYGLQFVTTDKTEVYEAPQLSSKNNERKFIECDERGLPIFVDENEISPSDRTRLKTLYASDTELLLPCVDRSGDLYSYWSDLADSNSDGRVVVVEGKD